MRTGSVDPSRISKRKRSPKPRLKRGHQQQAAPPFHDSKPAPAAAPTVAASPAVPEPPEMVASDTFEHVSCERLATTPAGGDGGIVDITKSFEVSKTFLPLIFSGNTEFSYMFKLIEKNRFWKII